MNHPVDVAILNAEIVDGSGGPSRMGDVACHDGRICFVGDFRGRATRTIDAYGMVLAPGFVDLHSHSDYSLLADPLARSKVYQGVTTEVGGNCGYHAAPIFGGVATEREAEYAASMALSATWRTSSEYRARLRHEAHSVNYAQQIGYNTLRSALTDDHARRLSVTERDALRRAVRAEFDEGAIGLSYGLTYVPACFSSIDELIDVAHEAASAKAFISFHMRDEGDFLLEAMEESFEIGRRSGAPVHLGHIKTFRRRNWHKIDDVLGHVRRERAAGMDLTVDRYPHLAMNTQFKFVLPQGALEGGVSAMKARLRDADVRARIVRELEATAGEEVKEILISLVSHPENKACEGKFLNELAQGHAPWEVALSLLGTEGDAAFATFFGMNQDNLDRILALDCAIVASDASVQAVDKQAGGGRPHPRCFDTFPYFLAEWVYARRQLSLPEAIRKITSLPSQRAGFVDRGLIGEGMHADLALLEPATLSASVSYESPVRYTRGVHTVLVNGVVVIDAGLHTGARPGALLARAR